MSAALVIVVAGLVAGVVLAGRRHPLPSPAPDAAVPSVSVIIPARNEEARLPRLLSCMSASTRPPREIIVVDDDSTDATAALARGAGARVLKTAPPPGWTGKSWACHRGAAEATGDVLVFLDADTEPAPAAIAALAGRAAAGRMVSAHPRHRVERAYERLSAGPALVSLLGAGTGGPVRHRWFRAPIAFGPAIAVPRDLYWQFGGHEAVRGDIAEDLALARAADSSGVPVEALLAGDQLDYRMYPEGVGSLLEGWTKNLATGAGSTPPLRLAASVLWVTAALQAPLVLVSDPSLLAVALVGAFMIEVGTLLRRIGRFGWATAVAYPLVLVAFVAIFARSLVVTSMSGTVSWRGRRVAVRT